MQPSFDLTGKRVLITGGRSGIGLAMALAMTRYGAAVTVTGLGTVKPEDESLQAQGLQVLQLDVRDTDAVAQFAEAFGALDILVNNAGLVIRDRAAFEIDAFQQVIDVNLTGVMRVCNAFYPRLKGSRGNVINTASLNSTMGAPKAIGYGASKAGLISLTKSLAIAWAEDGIRVNAIAPGWIKTKINTDMQENPDFDRYVVERTPLQRWGEPEDLAGGAVFLASDAASFITGSTLTIDGGVLAT